MNIKLKNQALKFHRKIGAVNK